MFHQPIVRFFLLSLYPYNEEEFSESSFLDIFLVAKGKGGIAAKGQIVLQKCYSIIV